MESRDAFFGISVSKVSGIVSVSSSTSRDFAQVIFYELLLCYLRDGENNFPSTPFKICAEINKNVYVPMKPKRIISATRRWEYFGKDYLRTIFPGVLLWNP